MTETAIAKLEALVTQWMTEKYSLMNALKKAGYEGDPRAAWQDLEAQGTTPEDWLTARGWVPAQQWIELPA